MRTTTKGISKGSKAPPPRSPITRELTVDPPAMTEEGPTTPLLTAMELNRITIVIKLLENNADPNQEGGLPTVSPFRATELITAIYHNCVDEATRLIDAGADVNEYGFAHATPYGGRSAAYSP